MEEKAKARVVGINLRGRYKKNVNILTLIMGVSLTLCSDVVFFTLISDGGGGGRIFFAW